jgi:N-acetylmuramoyl-L-alanine amidase
MYKLVIDAGHFYGTPGRRCTKSLDPNETREWWLNNRIADKLEKILAEYEGIETLRVDDTTGKLNIALKERVAAANEYNADFFLSIHANAADLEEDETFEGGGITAYVCNNASEKSCEMQAAIYKSLIKYTGLKGNRAAPLSKANHYVTSKTRMPAVLTELGFMNSSTDVPIILSEIFADNAAKAFAEVFIQESGATKKKKSLWCVQVGAYKERQNAEFVKQRLKKLGFDSIVKEKEV